VEGCLGSNGCVVELSENLNIFFATHVITSIVGVTIPIAKTYWAVRQEAMAPGKDGASGRVYRYVQAQAKCDPFHDTEAEFMDHILCFGFICMFSVVCPEMAFLAFFCNMVEMRLLAYRICKVNRRPYPTGCLGIGAWREIIRMLCYASVFSNVGLSIFAMEPLKSYPFVHKVLMYCVADHVMLALMFMIEYNNPEKTVSHIIMEETNNDCQDLMMGDDSKPVEVARCPRKAFTIPELP